MNIKKEHFNMFIEVFMRSVLSVAAMRTIQNEGDLAIFILIIVSILWILQATEISIIEDKYV